ncbi:hypothetical protein K438DRAFT_2019265 [Mycena galopus ATCC 62051]|nr:hypothetical protein K438DRAFT_2019265 [Mycena galopus ATCC 62051]
MRAYNLNALPLEDDILDRIMTFFPTFDTLRAAMLVSKAFYRVFQAHPKSITWAVSYNVVGPALPQALRVIRYPYYGHDLYDPDIDPTVMATAVPEDRNPSAVTKAEQEKLKENAGVVAMLEDIYSLLNKDRTSKTSLLTAEESFRFRRTMYRVMLYSTIFAGTRHKYEEIEDLDPDDIFFEKIRNQRTAVLNEYSTEGLQELLSTSKFLLDVYDDLSNSRSDAFLSMGPSGALRAWKSRSYDVLENDIDFNFLDEADDVPLYDGYISVPVKNILTTRNISLPEDEEPPSKWILDSVNGENDTCSQCAVSGGLKLYTEANWFRLPPWSYKLKSHLNQNMTIVEPFLTATAHLSAAPESLGPFITDLFSRRTDRFNGWKRTDSYCFFCLTKFVKEHLWRWFLDERIKNGWTPPENCWYGWDCWTQTYNREHAESKNHLCDPIKESKAMA